MTSTTFGSGSHLRMNLRPTGVVDEINEVTLKLVTFPHMGRAADMLRVGARIAIHGDYLVVYRPMDYGIAVLRACMVPESGRSLNIYRRRKSRGQLNFRTVRYAKTTEAIDFAPL